MTRGSLQYWQKRRAYRRLPRLRTHQKSAKEPTLSNIVGYKAGMSHTAIMEEGAKASEISRACTIIEVPTTEMYGVRTYSKERGTGYKKASKEVYDKAAAQRAGVKKVASDANLEALKSDAGITDVTALLVAYPKGIATGQHHPDRYEAAIVGNSIEEKIEFARKLLGKEIRPHDVFKNGEHVDVTSVSKGKGWQGVIKRFGVARLGHKSTQKVRHMAALGSFGMGRVLYSVPQAGQMGYNYRTEHNKRVLKMGKKEDAQQVNPKSGFINYGMVVSDYIIIDGSVAGPAKRLVRIKKSIGNRDAKLGIKEPKINYIATTGKAI